MPKFKLYPTLNAFAALVGASILASLAWIPQTTQKVTVSDVTAQVNALLAAKTNLDSAQTAAAVQVVKLAQLAGQLAAQIPVAAPPIDWTKMPLLVPGFQGEGPDVKLVGQIASGGYWHDLQIQGAQQAALINDNTTTQVGFLSLNKVRLVPNPKGTYWGGNEYLERVFLSDCEVRDMGGDPSAGKLEGHGIYNHGTDFAVYLRCTFTGNRANPIQQAWRPWEPGGPTDLVLVQGCQFIDNHKLYSDRAGSLISTYGLGPRSEIIVDGCTFSEHTIDAAYGVDSKGVAFGSLGMLAAVPAIEVPATWTGAKYPWTPGAWVTQLVRINGCTVDMANPKQSLCWLGSVGRVEIQGTSWTVSGNARIDIDHPLLTTSPGWLWKKSGHLSVHANTGTAVPIFDQGVQVGTTAQELEVELAQ